MKKSKTKIKRKAAAAPGCVYFKPQSADRKHLGCVQAAPCTQCRDCAYTAPKG